MEWMFLPYRRYADFSGRSRRMEFWMFTLFYYIALGALLAVMMAGLPWSNMEAPDAEPNAVFWIGFVLLLLFSLGSVVPAIAVCVRRFHDQDKSGWLYLLNFIPYIGPIIVIVFMFLEGTPGPNQYGDDPKDENTAGVFA